jgi:hypothetical protein
MTPAQQYSYLQDDEVDSRTGKSVVKFDSVVEAMAFMRRMNRAGI